MERKAREVAPAASAREISIPIATPSVIPGGDFVDNRPAALAQRKLNKSIAQSPRVVAQEALGDRIEHSPRMVAQRAQVTMIRGETVQRQDGTPQAKADPASNRTGLPDPLKAGIENLSGMNLDHIKVHYNSDKPAQLNAHAYAQGGDIHVAPGQERHLPHEAWHIVQQAQGRVKPTMQMKGDTSVNIGFDLLPVAIEDGCG